MARKKTIATLKMELTAPSGGMYVMILRSVGNPDFGQYAPISEPEAVKSATLAGMRRAAEAYIAKWDLGGGNFVDPEIRKDGKFVARISYNGRLWDHMEYEKANEIKID